MSCIVFQLQPSVSFPVTIDGFLCPPAHRGTQGLDRQRNRRDVQAVCPSVQLCVCVWKLRPGASLAGALMKTSVLDSGTNLYLSNVSSGD